MSVIVVGTNIVRLDEPCFGLSEKNLQSPGSKGFHRYQIIYVIRNDRIAEMRVDMGLARIYKAEEVTIPGGVRDPRTGRIEIFHTVGELRDIADYLRSGAHSRPEVTPHDLVQGYYNELDARRMRTRGRKNFRVQGRRVGR